MPLGAVALRFCGIAQMPVIRMLMVALMACAGAVHAADTPAGTPNPYSFADLFNLTVGAQQGLVTGTSVSMPSARGDWSQPLTPALFGGANVPSLTLGPAAASTAMIGISETAQPVWSVQSGHGYSFEKQLFPLGSMPQPAGWLIAASALLVAGFIARRRT